VRGQWSPSWWTHGLSGLEPVLELYRSAFTATRIPDERVRALLASGIYQLVTVSDATDLVGIALVAVFPASRFAHLDYIVTRDSSRRQGVASCVLRFLTTELASPIELLTLEISGPMGAFYGRRGALRLAGVPYIFPGASPVPEDLLAFPLAQQRALPGTRVADIIRTLYLEIHGLSPADPLLKQVLAGVPDSVSLTPP
jgi:hypothetical protein